MSQKEQGEATSKQDRKSRRARERQRVKLLERERPGWAPGTELEPGRQNPGKGARGSAQRAEVEWVG